jgi:hypothetical protein
MNPLRLLTFILASALLPSPSWSQDKPVAPFLTTRTATAGRKDVTSRGAGWSEKQAVRSMGVSVEYRFLQKPEIPYEAQCFFVAKDEANKQRYIYDCYIAPISNAFGSIEFNAQPLMGSGKRVFSIPFSGTTTSGQYVSGTLSSSSDISGSKVEGWIVRVVSNGTILNIESNQYGLKTLAQDNPDILDAMAKAARKATRDP